MRPLSRPVPRCLLCSLSMLLSVAVLSLVFGGCEKIDVATTGPTDAAVTTETTSLDATSSSAESTTSSTAASSSSEASSSSGSAAVSTSSEELLPNGNIRACGIIKQVWTDGGAHKIKIDYVDFLTGHEADAAAIADGEIVAGEHVDNDYYVRNKSAKLRTFTVSNSAVITTDERSNPSMTPTPHTWAEFAGFWTLSGEEAYLSRALWWIERDGDTVVKIEQQFVP